MTRSDVLSWSEAFAAASKIRPVEEEEEEDDILNANADSKGSDCGVHKVSELARNFVSKNEKKGEKKKKKKTKKKEKRKEEKKEKKKKTKKRKRDDDDNDDKEKKEAESEEPTGVSCSFPFPCNPDDHCETPLVAYQHIAPLLNRLFPSSPSPTIYDPYYCDGAVKRHLSSLGFPNVYNTKQDCYFVWNNDNDAPQFDILITNPPYSEDHIEKLIRYVTSSSYGSKPWLLLLPNWVHKKDYYQNILSPNRKPFYVLPRKRYVYLPPKHYRPNKISDTHKKNSPFVTMWHCWGGTTQRNEQLIQFMYREGIPECDFARSKNALRDLRRNASNNNTNNKAKKTNK